MSDQTNDAKENEEGKSFSELIDAYEDGMGEDLQVGDQVEGEIIAVGQDTVFINTGSKIDGAVNREELLDENGELPHAVGDKLTGQTQPTPSRYSPSPMVWIMPLRKRLTTATLSSSTLMAFRL